MEYIYISCAQYVIEKISSVQANNDWIRNYRKKITCYIPAQYSNHQDSSARYSSRFINQLFLDEVNLDDNKYLEEYRRNLVSRIEK